MGCRIERSRIQENFMEILGHLRGKRVRILFFRKIEGFYKKNEQNWRRNEGKMSFAGKFEASSESRQKLLKKVR